MAEKNEVPPTRAHWLHLILDNDRSMIISVVLLLLGAIICWFSLSKIREISAPPFRVSTDVQIITSGCEATDLSVFNFAHLREFGLIVDLYDEPDVGSLPLDGCFIKRITFAASHPLHEMETDFSEFIEIRGRTAKHFEHLGNGRIDSGRRSPTR